MTEAAKEMIWLRGFLGELSLKQASSFFFFKCQPKAQSTIHLAKNLVFHMPERSILICEPFHSLAFGGWGVVTREDIGEQKSSKYVDEASHY